MSDFDAVLERLLNEPSFASALAADPGAALAGYQLTAGEADLLRSQVSADSGGGVAAVEARTNKSSTFGLFSSLAEVGHTVAQGPGGDVAFGPWSQFGRAAGSAVRHTTDAVGSAGAGQGLGDSPAAWGSGAGDVRGHWPSEQRSGLGPAPGHDVDGLPPTTERLGDAPESGLGDAGQPSAQAEQVSAPRGYHPRIDADGDGHWDKATFSATRGHGVEIRVDLDGDGHADFVGHDTDTDGRVDYADYDKDHDGVYEKRMVDDDGDGWLDRTVRPGH